MKTLKIYLLRLLVFAGFTAFKEDLILTQMDVIKSKLRKAKKLLKELDNLQ